MGRSRPAQPASADNSMTGAGVSEEVRRRIVALFGGRCAYCRSPLFLFPGSEHIEHIFPRASGGLTDEENLCLACSRCNLRKGSRTNAFDRSTRKTVALFHPRRQRWTEHFRWSHNFSRINGRSASGRATVDCLRLNDAQFIRARKRWLLAGWHPPREN
jgi:hypothetical protein